MKFTAKKVFILICTLALCVTACTVPVFADFNSSVQGSYAEAYYVVSLNEDATVIAEKNSTARTAPASLTKIMTAIVALENCSDLDNTMVTVSNEAIDSLAGTNSSIIELEPGNVLSMRYLIEGMLILSGNDAANAIAEYIGNQKDGGGVDTFVRLMNEKAAALGCADTHFMNPHGLDTDGHYTTAQDLAKMAKYALDTFPVFSQIVSQTYYKLPNDDATLPNTNYMLVPAFRSYYNPYITGVKTGTTSNAGCCVVATARSGGYNYMAVVLRAPRVDSNGDGIDENGAFVDANTLLNWSIENLRLSTVASSQDIVTEVPLKYSGKSDYLQLVPESDVTLLVPTADGTNAPAVLIEPIAESLPESVSAPVEKGEVICQARVLYANQEIATVNLVAAESYSMSPFALVGSVLSTVFHSLAFKIIAVIVVLLVIAYIIIVIRYNRIRKKRRIRLVKGSKTSQEFRAAPKTSMPNGGRELKRNKHRRPPKR